MSRKARTNIIVAILLILAAGSVAARLILSKYTFERIIPQPSYSVAIVMNFTGNGEDVVVRTFLPQSENAQTVRNVLNDAAGLNFSRHVNNQWVSGEWSAYQAAEPYSIRYSFDVQIRPVVFNIDPTIVIPDSYPDNFDPYLEATNVIQVHDPVIADLIQEIGIEDSRHVVPVLNRLYAYVESLDNRPFKGTTDAVTAAKLGAASCNGKSRLFVAMARRLGIPSRLVGGLILNNGSKRTTHQWVEVYVAGHWIPIDALNSHFAELPGNYLVLYRGDEAMFRHSRNIGFDYHYEIKKQTVTNERLAGYLGRQTFNFYSVLDSLMRGNVSLGVLQFLFVIPLGVFVVVLARNVIGVNTLGTFLPALMAMAVRQTGLVAGMVAFLLVLLVTVLLRFPLDRLGILHTPKLAVMMVVVIVGLLGLSGLSGVVHWDAFSTIGAVSLFPIAILTITSERLALTLVEEGVGNTVLILLQTVIIMTVCFIVMSSVALQAIMIAFPELLLAVVALNLWIGSWTGLRVVEMFRFRSLYAEDHADED